MTIRLVGDNGLRLCKTKSLYALCRKKVAMQHSRRIKTLAPATLLKVNRLSLDPVAGWIQLFLMEETDFKAACLIYVELRGGLSVACFQVFLQC